MLVDNIFNSHSGLCFGFHGGPLQKKSLATPPEWVEKVEEGCAPIIVAANVLQAVSWIPIAGGLISGPVKIFFGILACRDKNWPDYATGMTLIARGVVELIPGSCLIIIPLDIVFSIGRCFCSEEFP